MNRKEKIYEFILDKNYKPMSYKDMLVLLSVPKSDKNKFSDILSSLELEGKIFKNSKNKYEAVDNSGLIKGVFSSKGKSYGFVVTDDDEKIFISPSDTLGAIDKDIVLIKKTKTLKKSEKCNEGKIVKIISHGIQTVIGTYEQKKNFAFVVPDSKCFKDDIYISKKHCVYDADGKKVCVKITKWPDGDKKAEGTIEKVLGEIDGKNVDMHCILAEFDISKDFSKKAMLSALSFGGRVYEEEIKGREDFREHLIFTIDGEDAKDLDDAISIEELPNGNYKLSRVFAHVKNRVSLFARHNKDCTQPSLNAPCFQQCTLPPPQKCTRLSRKCTPLFQKCTLKNQKCTRAFSLGAFFYQNMSTKPNKNGSFDRIAVLFILLEKP